MSVTALSLYQKGQLQIPKLAWSMLRNLLCCRHRAVLLLQLRTMRRKCALERNVDVNGRQSCCWQMTQMMQAHNSREDYAVVLAQEACLEQSSRRAKMQQWNHRKLPDNDGGSGLPRSNRQGRRPWWPQPMRLRLQDLQFRSPTVQQERPPPPPPPHPHLQALHRPLRHHLQLLPQPVADAPLHPAQALHHKTFQKQRLL